MDAPAEKDPYAPRELKFTVVGSRRIGKTRKRFAVATLRETYAEGEFPEIPEFAGIRDRFKYMTTADGTYLKIKLEDTCAIEGFEEYRTVPYPGTDIFLLCFNVVDPESLEEICTTYIQLVRETCQNTPYILVGLKADLRSDPAVLEKLAQKQQKPVSLEQAEYALGEIQACARYFEVSSKTMTGLDELMEYAVDLALHPEKVERAKHHHQHHHQHHHKHHCITM